MERHVRSYPYELLTNCWGPFYSNKLILIPVWISNEIHYKSKSKSKSKKTLFNVGQCKQYNISSHLKWVLVADKSMHMIIYNKIHIK